MILPALAPLVRPTSGKYRSQSSTSFGGVLSRSRPSSWRPVASAVTSNGAVAGSSRENRPRTASEVVPSLPLAEERITSLSRTSTSTDTSLIGNGSLGHCQIPRRSRAEPTQWTGSAARGSMISDDHSASTSPAARPTWPNAARAAAGRRSRKASLRFRRTRSPGLRTTLPEGSSTPTRWTRSNRSPLAVSSKGIGPSPEATAGISTSTSVRTFRTLPSSRSATSSTVPSLIRIGGIAPPFGPGQGSASKPWTFQVPSPRSRRRIVGRGTMTSVGSNRPWNIAQGS